MTDAHTHIDRGDARSLVCEPTQGNAHFIGFHPWEFLGAECVVRGAECLEARLKADPSLGVGEIGLDRLKARAIPDAMREAFSRQLELAAAYRRPVVLHGAKCWGEVVAACRPYAGRIPAFLFHGFSRSGGLLPDIIALNGFVSVGPAILNDHAVNYRGLAKSIPDDRILVESDATAENAASTPRVGEVAAKLASLRGITLDALAHITDANADRFLCGLASRS